MKKLLFVCMGNICRSPAAEGVMQAYIERDNLHEELEVDSCGTHGYHVGHPADERVRFCAQRRGFDLTSVSRQFDPINDFIESDYILVMDDDNYEALLSYQQAEKYANKVHKLTDFCVQMQATHVPDPYYEGEDGFELVMDIIEDACGGLLGHLTKSKDQN